MRLIFVYSTLDIERDSVSGGMARRGELHVQAGSVSREDSHLDDQEWYGSYGIR